MEPILNRKKSTQHISHRLKDVKIDMLKIKHFVSLPDILPKDGTMPLRSPTTAEINLKSKKLNNYSTTLKKSLVCDFEDIDEEIETNNDTNSVDLALVCNQNQNITISSFYSNGSSSSVITRTPKHKTSSGLRSSIVICDSSENSKEEVLIMNIIKIQSIMRMYLVKRNIKKKEEKRLEKRNMVEKELIAEYNKKIEEIKDDINKGKKNAEIIETKELFEEYVKEIFSSKSNAEDTLTNLHYLFKLCDEDDKDGLNKEEFLILVNQILDLITPKDCYSNLFKDKDRIEFEEFFSWLSCYIETSSFDLYSSMKYNISSLFKKKSRNPYLKHIKCVYYLKMVNEKLKEFDKLNPSEFYCPICNTISINPLKLSQHIIQCRMDLKTD